MALDDENVPRKLFVFSRIQFGIEWLPKKTVYCALSVALLAFLISTFVTDATALLVTEEVDKTTQGWTFSVLVS